VSTYVFLILGAVAKCLLLASRRPWTRAAAAAAAATATEFAVAAELVVDPAPEGLRLTDTTEPEDPADSGRSITSCTQCAGNRPDAFPRPGTVPSRRPQSVAPVTGNKAVKTLRKAKREILQPEEIL